MKVIFLDFDGVITIPPKYIISEDKLKYIKRIVDETNAKIVVSSSWRRHSVDETIETMVGRPSRCPNNIMLEWFINNLYDVTPWVSNKKYNGTGRGGEIQTWLDSHPEVDNYVIIDDEGDMMESQLFHFVQTNYEDGITEVEAVRTIKILNRKYIQNSMAINFELQYKWRIKCNGYPKSWENIKQYNDHCKDINNRY